MKSETSLESSHSQASRRRWPQGLVLTLLSVLALAAAAHGEDSQTQWAELLDGSQFELCREYQRGLEEWKASYTYCGVALPSGNADFRLPRWESMDPADNMDLVRTIFYWSNATNNPHWDYKYYRERQAVERDIVPDMLARLWEPARADVQSLIAEGRIKLERSRLDLNFDGRSEPVYRMTPVFLNPYFGKPGKPEFVRYRLRLLGDHCKSQGLPGDKETFVYYVSPDDSLQVHEQLRLSSDASDLRYFYWRGRAYYLRGSAIQEPVPFADPGFYFLRQVCNYRLKRK